MIPALAFALFIGYLLGSVPFGFLAAKAKGVDIRQHGSGNIGATNVWRVCGWRFGLPVFILDALKGVGAVWVGKWIVGSKLELAESAMVLSITSAAGCILGHSFPVWLKFKGGKGVATSLGVMIGLMPLASLIAFAVWAVVFKVSGYVSLASIVAAVVLPSMVGIGNITGWAYGWPPFWFALLAGVLVIVRHKSNIARLRAGTESRFRKKTGGAS